MSSRVVTLLTQSRSGYAGCAVGILVVVAWWLVVEQRSGRAKAIGGAVVTALTVGAALILRWLAISWTGSAADPDALAVRFELWNRGLAMLEDFPFTGVGVGQFTDVLNLMYAPTLMDPSVRITHAHNFLLQVWLDFGVGGAIAMVLVLAGFFRCVWMAWRSAPNPEFRAAAVGLGAGMVSFLVYGLTDAVVVGARMGVGLWVVLGLGAALAAVARRSKAEHSVCAVAEG